MKLLLMRHAESQGNFQMRLQGRREYPLTERGIQQAERLAERLADAGLAAVYASPITRALDTAKALAAKTGLAVVTEPRVQEYDFGEALSGLTWKEIQEKRPDLVAALMTDNSDFPRYPGEEGRGAFRQRVSEALAEVIERHKDDAAVAVVTHAGPIVVYVMETLGRRYSRPIPFSIHNASLTTLEFNHDGPAHLPPVVLTGLNDTCHLTGELAPIRTRLTEGERR